MKYPYQSSDSAIQSAFHRGQKIISDALGKHGMNQLRMIEEQFAQGNDSLRQNSFNGELNPNRQRIHNKIINNQFRNKSSIDKKDPDLYIFGGLPASGKSSVLTKHVPEPTVVIDSDYYKKKLSPFNPSPLRNYPLANAQLLHEESDQLVEQAIERAIREKRNITFDATFKNVEKGKRLIQRLKNAGYDIHFLGTQKSPSKTIVHAAKRFIKPGGEGRYVPLDYIKRYGNQISANSWRARLLADTYQVYDTSNIRKPKLIAKSRKPMSWNFRNP